MTMLKTRLGWLIRQGRYFFSTQIVIDITGGSTNDNLERN